MISVIMPYFRRYEILKRNIEKYREFYENIEIIVVNDGDDPPDVDAMVINLKKKDEPLNPCVPINIGVRAATHDICAITGPEIYQPSPRLEPLIEIAEADDKAWVTAATWGHINSRWHCHTSVNKEKHHVSGLPKEAGFHFLAVFNRQFYLDIGGMDERYRYGKDYDDNDLVCNLHYNGAHFHCLDHVVVDHIRTPRLHWNLRSNREVFKAKWTGIYDFKSPTQVPVHTRTKNSGSEHIQILPAR